MAKHTFSISLSRNDGDEKTESAIKRLCKDEDVPFSSFVLTCIMVDKFTK